MTHAEWLEVRCTFCDKRHVDHSGSDWHRHVGPDGQQLTEIVEVMVSDRWPLRLPQHRAARSGPSSWAVWERERLASMHALLGVGDVVYDVGAEEGDLPALWATWGCDVFLFEPNPKVWPNIRAVWEANDLAPPLGWVVGFAAAEDLVPPASEWFEVDYSHPVGVWPACALGKIIGDHGFLNLSERPDVERARIDTVAERVKPPTALTIDVEGAELAVLSGASAVLSETRPLVWVSIHPEFSVEMYGTTREDVVSLMDAHSYTAELLATDHEEHWLFTPR